MVDNKTCFKLVTSIKLVTDKKLEFLKSQAKINDQDTLLQPVINQSNMRTLSED